MWIGLGLGIAAFAALAFYGDLGDPRAFAARVSDYDGRWFVLGLIGATLNYVLRFARWELYLRRLGIRVPTLASARIFVAGFAMSISPGKVGEVVKSALLADEFDVAIERSAPIVLAERLTDLIALVLLVAVSSLVVPHGIALAIPAFAGVCALLALFAIPSFGRAAIRLVGRFRIGRALAPKLRGAHDALLEILAPSPLAAATMIAVASWFLECLSLWAIVRGFPGVSLGIGEATFAYSAPTIAGAVALMPGGLLVTEASMTGTLRLIGGLAMTSAVAATTTFLVRLATLWWAVILGLFALAISRRAAASSSPRMQGTHAVREEALESPTDAVTGP